MKTVMGSTLTDKDIQILALESYAASLYMDYRDAQHDRFRNLYVDLATRAWRIHETLVASD